eukprot:scaffold11262_cov20-Cyclotella_meneghiniana.AAC.1
MDVKFISKPANAAPHRSIHHVVPMYLRPNGKCPGIMFVSSCAMPTSHPWAVRKRETRTGDNTT